MASSTFNPTGSGPAAAPTTAPPTTAAPSTAPVTAPTTTVPPSAAPVASPTTAAPSTGAPVTPPTTTATTGPNADNIEVLRQSHETLKGLGDLNAVRGGLGVFQQVWGEAQRLGAELEYTNESLQEAFKADPVGTVALLRQEAAQQRNNPEGQRQREIDDAVRRATAPITEQFARQAADRHNAAIDSEFTRMFNANEAFKPRNGAEAPAEVRGIIHDRFIETLKWNQAALAEVVQGKMSGLQKIFDEVAADTLKAWNTYNSWGNGNGSPTTGVPTTTSPVGTIPPASTSPPSGQMRDARTGRFVPIPTLEQIAEGDGAADVLPSMRGFK